MTAGFVLFLGVDASWTLLGLRPPDRAGRRRHGLLERPVLGDRHQLGARGAGRVGVRHLQHGPLRRGRGDDGDRRRRLLHDERRRRSRPATPADEALADAVRPVVARAGHHQRQRHRPRPARRPPPPTQAAWPSTWRRPRRRRRTPCPSPTRTPPSASSWARADVGAERMTVADIDWIPAGTTFGVDEMTFFAGRGERDLDDVLGDIDLIVTGPHASAAFPAEMPPFVDPGFTRRLQYDFTDVSTSPVARRWAEIDPHVLYIEDPHPRAVRDANRPRPADLLAGAPRGVRAARRRRRRRAGRRSPASTRCGPVTFGYLPVLSRPSTEDEWQRARRRARDRRCARRRPLRAHPRRADRAGDRGEAAPAGVASTRRPRRWRSGARRRRSTSCRSTTR